MSDPRPQEPLEYRVMTTRGPMLVTAGSMEEAEAMVEKDGHTLVPRPSWIEAAAKEICIYVGEPHAQEVSYVAAIIAKHAALAGANHDHQER